MHDEELKMDEATVNADEVDANVSSVEQELAQVKDQWLRAVADLENLKRRAQKDKEDAHKFAIAGFARQLLDVSDNVQRALFAKASFYQKIENHPDKDFFISFIDGVDMIRQAFATALESQGIKPVPAVGAKFDPNVHQALMEVETNQQEPGTVVQVVQEGYMIHDRLLRPAMVGVAKLPSEKKEDKIKDGHINMSVDI